MWKSDTYAIYNRKAVATTTHCMKGNVALKIGPMTSSDRCDVIYILLRYSTTHDTATCYNNKLTSLIYDGVRAVDWKQAKMMEGSSATNKTR